MGLLDFPDLAVATNVSATVIWSGEAIIMRSVVCYCLRFSCSFFNRNHIARFVFLLFFGLLFGGGRRVVGVGGGGGEQGRAVCGSPFTGSVGNDDGFSGGYPRL